MTEKWVIETSRQKTIGVTPCWEIRMIRADGNPHVLVMPTTALEWRAAEYGIDPTDTDTLLEVLLHEPFMDQAEDEDGQRPGYADGSIHLLTAENTTMAREAHLARVKGSRVRIDVRGAAGLAPVRAGHRPDPDRIRSMREAVDTTRWITKYGALPIQPSNRPEARRA